jgi:2-oxoglutarate dehydrogenase E1 component
MTPKSLLRAEAAKSHADEFTGTFRPVLPDPTPPPEATRLLLCTGKVAYDLLDHRRKQADSRSAIVRIERPYPFPADELSAVLRAFPDVRELRWVQEEPANMGAWSFLAPHLRELAPALPLGYAGRPESPSPATGSARIFQIEQERVVAEALTEAPAGTPAPINR